MYKADIDLDVVGFSPTEFTPIASAFRFGSKFHGRNVPVRSSSSNQRFPDAPDWERQGGISPSISPFVFLWCYGIALSLSGVWLVALRRCR